MSTPPLVSIVDDDESVRRGVTNLLTSAGYAVDAFRSADAFLQSARLAHTRALVLDLRLPGMSGLELQRHLVARGHRIPIIILTAHGTETEQQQALRFGAVAFLRKPFKPKDLLDPLKTALADGE
jgi:FixJ family two-component response regulator